MSRSYVAAVSLFSVVVLLASCPLPSQAGLQAFFYTDSSCYNALNNDNQLATYLDWQHIPNADINFYGTVNTTCVTPPPIDNPNTYQVVSATYNCNVNSTAAGSAGSMETLYVAEWLTPGQCGSYFSSPSTSNAPDYVYTAPYLNNTNGSCLAGATYLNKSMTSSLAVYARVFCINNGNGASSTASVPGMLLAFAMMLAAIAISL